jgi:hypothetical protein
MSCLKPPSGRTEPAPELAGYHSAWGCPNRTGRAVCTDTKNLGTENSNGSIGFNNLPGGIAVSEDALGAGTASGVTQRIFHAIRIWSGANQRDKRRKFSGLVQIGEAYSEKPVSIRALAKHHGIQTQWPKTAKKFG